VAAELASRLVAAGIVVDATTTVEATTTTDAATSAVQYPEGEMPQAKVLAAALGLAGSEQLAPVDHVTVVIGAEDSDGPNAAPLVC
jgi:hypothetical protein